MTTGENAFVTITEDNEWILPKGISDKPYDGMCFKLTWTFMLDPGDGLSEERVYYSEDNSLLVSMAQFLVNYQYTPRLVIEDDSK